MRYTIAALGIIALTAMAVISQAANVTARWSPPTTGSPAVGYVLEVYYNDSLATTVTVQDTVYVLQDVEQLVSYTARVRAYDALNRVGPWSVMSEPYVWDQGAPGSCGPVRWNVN